MTDIFTPVRMFHRHKPKIEVKRGDTTETNGDVQVWIDEFLYISLHYDYRYTNNAIQWTLANQIADALKEEDKQ